MILRVSKRKGAPPQPIGPSTLQDEGWEEKDLENYLFENLPVLVGKELLVVGQSSPFQPEVDLLAIDKHGDIWFFELKRHSGEEEHLLQVLRYSQSYSSYTVDDFDAIYRKHSKGRGAEKSLALAFCEYFGYDEAEVSEWSSKIGKKHHFVVVADGADDRTNAAVAHWQDHGLDLQIWPYRIYPDGSKAHFLLELPELRFRGRRIGLEEPRVFLVNTNRRYEPTAQEFMIASRCVMATSHPWTERINRIPTGARVLLYENGKGIVAAGEATALRRLFTWRAANGSDVPARSVKLRSFRLLDIPLSPKEVWAVAEKQYGFQQTVQELRGESGERVWQAALKGT